MEIYGDAFLFNPFLVVLIFYLLFLDILYIVNVIFDKKILKVFYPKWWYIVIYFVLWFLYTIYINIV